MCCTNAPPTWKVYISLSIKSDLCALGCQSCHHSTPDHCDSCYNSNFPDQVIHHHSWSIISYTWKLPWWWLLWFQLPRQVVHHHSQSIISYTWKLPLWWLLWFQLPRSSHLSFPIHCIICLKTTTTTAAMILTSQIKLSMCGPRYKLHCSYVASHFSSHIFSFPLFLCHMSCHELTSLYWVLWMLDDIITNLPVIVS